jgi:hypothetical protein
VDVRRDALFAVDCETEAQPADARSVMLIVRRRRIVVCARRNCSAGGSVENARFAIGTTLRVEALKAASENFEHAKLDDCVNGVVRCMRHKN